MTPKEQLIHDNPELVARIKEKYSRKIFIRTCQDCGHEQQDTEPKIRGQYSTAYEFRKCKKCKGESLDHGSKQLRFPWTPEEQAFINKLEELDT